LPFQSTKSIVPLPTAFGHSKKPPSIITMSIQPPQGILNIPNATLRVGKLAVDSTAGFDTVFNNVERNTILLEDSTEYTETKQWDLKMPNIFVATFEIKGGGSSFNFRNTSNGDATTGYTLTFSGTTLTLKYDNASLTTATIPNLDSVYRKVYVTFEKQHFTVTVDGTLVLTYKDATTRTPPEGEYANFFKGTGSPGFKNLKVVAGHLISDGMSNVSLYGGLAVTSNLEVGSSNLFVDTLNTRVGVGTTEPDASLHVTGNAYITSNLEVGQANLFVDTLNTRVGVGTTEPKESLDVVGNMHLTRVSNVSQIKVDSNVVTEYTGPHDRPLRKYPEVELDVNAMTSPGVGGYIVTQSGQYSGAFAGWTVFGEEFTTTNAEGSGGAWIDGSPGSYAKEAGETPNGVVGSVLTTVQNAGTLKLASNTPVGAWVSLELPTSIKLQRIEMRPRLQHLSETDLNEVALQSFPREFGIWGYDGSNWVLLKSVTGHSAGSAFGYTPTHVNATTAYNKYAIVVTRTNAVGGSNSDDRNFTAIGQLYFYGHEEGSGSLDTTLKSVYNVPATTGTQLEVYYDAKDLTTMPSTVTDLAGGDQNGTVTGHSPTLDSTDGIDSFVFDGVDDYITTTLTNPNTDWVHSVSMWVYPIDVSDDSVNGYIFAIGPEVSNQVSALRFKPDGFNYTRWTGGGSKTFNGPVTSGRWHHVTLISPGSTDVQVYLDGRLLTHTSDSLATLTLPQNTSLSVGRFAASASYSRPFTGSIANFRLYSKALNADQVKELYDYQKDYFLGSKSQVTLYKGHLGVGVTEPSGQLELAGDERIQEYPPRGMTHSDGTAVGSQTTGQSKNITYIEGHGEFKASASEWSVNTIGYDGHQPYNAFEDTPNRRWLIYENVGYNATTGAYEDNEYQLSASSGTPYGHWLKLEMPYPVNIRNYYMKANNTSHGAKDWQVWASNDGINWTHIHSYTNETSANSFAGSYYNVSHTGHYKMFAIIVTRIFDASTYDRIDIFRVKYFGTPGPTTLDKGSLSLTRSLDVPRISRYDVDTETPRPEKLVVDFDTTVNSSPTDISGKGNHGTFYNGASYSPADKAFNFDGTDDYIKLDTGLTGNVVHSISMWVKAVADFDTGNIDVVLYWGAGGSGSHRVEVYMADDIISYNFASNDYNVTLPTNTLVNDRWYHLVFTYNGVGGASGREVYIDGVKQTGSHTGSTDVLTLANSDLYLASNFSPGGQYHFGGQISNFKLYNVALEPSEVQKLYRLGRTGRSMVISDTAVGIGKVPEAQLDVRGSGGFTGSLVTGGSSYVGGLPSSSFDYLNPSLHVNSLPKNMLRLQVKNRYEIPTLDDFPNVYIKTIMPNGNDSYLDSPDDHYYNVAKDPYGRSCIVFRCRGTDTGVCGGWNRLNVPASYRRSYMSVVFVKSTGTASSGAKFYHGCSTTNTANFSGDQVTNPYFHYIDYSSLPIGVWCVSIGFVHFKGASSGYSTGKAGMYRLDTMAKIDTGTEYTFYDEYDEQTQRAFYYNNTLSGAYLDIWNPGWFDTQTIFPETDILNVFTNDLVETSDDRLKSDERFIRGALDSIMKLKPQLYKKHLALDSVDETVQEESGLMAQDIYYDTPELRHVVKPGEDYGAIKSIVPIQSDDPNADPDYTEWGKNPAKVDYRGLIPYTIKAIQELNTEMTRSKFRIVGVPYSRLMDYTGLCVRSVTPDEVELTTLSNDKSVVGVLSTTQNINEYEDSRVLVDILGKGGIWVIDTGSIHNGDYLTTSNIVSGYAQVQTDDLVHSYTVAKALQDVDFTEVQKPVRIIKQELSNVSRWIKREYRTVSKDTYDKLDENVRCITTVTIPITDDETEEQTLDKYKEIIIHESRVQIPGYELEVRQELVNVLDEHGQIQWEDHPTETEKAYKIRYLDANGAETDETNHVYKAAFVGCTYHCG
jgi:hypothetical protein